VVINLDPKDTTTKDPMQSGGVSNPAGDTTMADAPSTGVGMSADTTGVSKPTSTVTPPSGVKVEEPVGETPAESGMGMGTPVSTMDTTGTGDTSTPSVSETPTADSSSMGTVTPTAASTTADEDTSGGTDASGNGTSVA
jgi:hypothetical protein